MNAVGILLSGFLILIAVWFIQAAIISAAPAIAVGVVVFLVLGIAFLLRKTDNKQDPP